MNMENGFTRMSKVVVFGSRTVDVDFCVTLLGNILKDKQVSEIISGTADGADEAGEVYSSIFGISLKQFPPDYKQFGTPAALFVRNTQMAKECDYGIALWDGMSRGTQHMMGEMKRFGKHYELWLISPGHAKNMTPTSIEDFV